MADRLISAPLSSTRIGPVSVNRAAVTFPEMSPLASLAVTVLPMRSVAVWASVSALPEACNVVILFSASTWAYCATWASMAVGSDGLIGFWYFICDTSSLRNMSESIAPRALSAEDCAAVVLPADETAVVPAMGHAPLVVVVVVVVVPRRSANSLSVRRRCSSPR